MACKIQEGHRVHHNLLAVEDSRQCLGESMYSMRIGCLLTVAGHWQKHTDCIVSFSQVLIRIKLVDLKRLWFGQLASGNGNSYVTRHVIGKLLKIVVLKCFEEVNHRSK